ncbi:MAG: prepilin-type N-terminal cleavage/methylation domain-containing protein [Planctomycetota bacterium]
MRSTHRHRQAPLLPNGRRAFTLIELLVTISIITILVGITIPFATRMLDRSDVTRTQATLNALSAALDEYKLATGDVPNHTRTTGSSASEPIANLVVSDDDTDTTIGLFFSRVAQLGGTADSVMRSGIGRQGLTWNGQTDPPPFAQAVRDGDIEDYLNVELWTLEDPWGTKLRYAARISHGDDFTDDDYLPAHPTPFFASAGPDGEWGNAQRLTERENGQTLTDEELEDAAEAEDNVYSFQID